MAGLINAWLWYNYEIAETDRSVADKIVRQAACGVHLSEVPQHREKPPA